MEEYIVEEPTVAHTTEENKKEDAKDGEESKSNHPPVSVPKKKYRKVELDIISDVFTLSKDEMKKALELEVNMANEDRLITETADKRNELESYLYSMRDKLDGVLKPYTAPAMKERLQTLMNSTEDWLYGDGFDSSKAEYVRKLEELRALSNPSEARLMESEARPAALEALRKQIELCKVSELANRIEANRIE
jgi:heat shock protein 4